MRAFEIYCTYYGSTLKEKSFDVQLSLCAFSEVSDSELAKVFKFWVLDFEKQGGASRKNWMCLFKGNLTKTQGIWFQICLFWLSFDLNMINFDWIPFCIWKDWEISREREWGRQEFLKIFLGILHSSSSQSTGFQFLRRNLRILGRKLRNLLLRSRHLSISSMEFLDSRLPLLVLPWNSIFPWKIPNFLPRRVGGIQISNLDFQTSQSGIQKFLPRKSENPSARLMESSIRLMEFFNHRLPRIQKPQIRIFPAKVWKSSLSRLDGIQISNPGIQKFEMEF